MTYNDRLQDLAEKMAKQYHGDIWGCVGKQHKKAHLAV